MSKKLVSLVIAVAIVMSILCAAFPTAAAAEEIEEKLTYYFLAPNGFEKDGSGIGAYWWIPSEPDGWPGIAMKAVPEIGKNVYEVTAPSETEVIIFNNFNNGKQTVNIALYDDVTGAKCFGGMIYVVTSSESGSSDTEIVSGEWCSIDPNDDNYYRKSKGYNIIDDTEPTTDVPADGKETADTPDTPDVAGKVITFRFRCDGEKFKQQDKILFYFWDETATLWGTKNGWVDHDVWWSSVNLRTGTVVEGTDDLVESYPIFIPDDHNVFVIVNDRTNSWQTCDVVITADANGDILYTTENLYEHPLEESDRTVEALFEKTENCGPHKMLTSSCKVIGKVFQKGEDPAQVLAEAVYDNIVSAGLSPESDSDWNMENVRKAMEDLGITVDDVWAAYTDKYEDNETAKLAITGEKEADHTPGDINGDSKVNMKDLTRLHQYINGWKVTVNESALDVNGDGKVNMKDLTRLHQYINGWDVKIS